MTDAHFIAALNALELEVEVIRAGHNRLLSLIPAALATLEEAIENGNVHAALQVLKHGLFTPRTAGSISPKIIAKELEVSDLQQEVALHKQQADFLEVREETIKRHENVEHKRRWRIFEEQRNAAEREERRLRDEAREAAAAQEKQAAQQRAAEAQKAVAAPAQKPAEPQGTHPGHAPMKYEESASTQPVQPSQPASQPTAKQPGQSQSRASDARISSAAQAVAGKLSNPGMNSPQSASSPDANAAQNPGIPAKS